MSSSFDPFAIIKQQQEENKYRTQVLDLRNIAEHPNNDFPITKEDVLNLADSIQKSDGILQFPLVRLLQDGTYQMLAGHRRRKASILLGETVDEKFFRTMCYVLENISDERAELFLIDTNIQARSLSPKFKARKVAEARRLIQSLMNRGELEATSVKRAVAEHIGMSESTVILQTRIAEKLDKDLLELYDQGKITMREAYDYSGLSPDSQELILEAYLKDLSKEDLEDEIRQIIFQGKLGVNNPKKIAQDASKKIKQVHKRLSDLSALKEDGFSLDKNALVELRDIIEKLLRG